MHTSAAWALVGDSLATMRLIRGRLTLWMNSTNMRGHKKWSSLHKVTFDCVQNGEDKAGDKEIKWTSKFVSLNCAYSPALCIPPPSMWVAYGNPGPLYINRRSSYYIHTTLYYTHTLPSITYTPPTITYVPPSLCSSLGTLLERSYTEWWCIVLWHLHKLPKWAQRLAPCRPEECTVG